MTDSRLQALVVSCALVLLISPLGVSQTGYTIHTIAGGGLPEGIAGTAADLGDISSVAVDAQGSVYIALGRYAAIMRLDPAGYLTRVAGNGTIGRSGDGGPAISAQISYGDKIALDSAGNLYIAESRYGVIRKVSKGIITTIAGGGWSFTDGPATAAYLYKSPGIAIDAEGNIFITQAQTVRKISGGMVTTVVGTGVAGFSGDGGPAREAQLYNPKGLAVDGEGNLYIADMGNDRIRKVANGIITTVAGGYPPVAALLTLERGGGDVATDASGNVFITDNGLIRKIAGGSVTTVAGVGPTGIGWDHNIGDNGPALSAKFSITHGLAVGPDGSLYVADWSYDSPRIRKISNGLVTTIAGGGTAAGNGRPAKTEMLGSISNLAVDTGGRLLITEDHRVRAVRGGIIDTVAGNGETGPPRDLWNGLPATAVAVLSPGAVATDPSGSIYVSAQNNLILKISEGLATRVLPDNVSSGGIATDSAGNVYFSEWYYNRVRKISGGTVTTLAGKGTAGYSGDYDDAANAELNLPHGVAVDIAGAVYIADTRNGVVRKVSNGLISTVPSSPAWRRTDEVYDIAVDSAGDLYATGYFNGVSSVKKISNGSARTIAGGGTEFVDGGPGTNTAFQSGPHGIAVDASGRVYLGDTENNRIRVLIPSRDADGRPRVLPVSAATNEIGLLAAGSLATVYGEGFTSAGETAGVVPSTALAGVTLTVRDATGAEHSAPLLYASPSQINFLIPDAATAGAGTFTVKTAGGAVLSASLDIARVSPGLFTLNRSMLAAANVVRVRGDGSQSVEPVYRLENGSVVANPVDLGPETDRVYLSLYGTGIRRAAAGSVSVTIGGVRAETSYAGPQGSFPGEDQINVLVPRSLAGKGPVPVVVTAEGYASNNAYMDVR